MTEAEMSLYSELEIKDEIIKKLKESNDFYANKENWQKQNQTNQTIIKRIDVEYYRISHNSFYLNYGGKKAREVKEEIALLEKGLDDNQKKL